MSASVRTVVTHRFSASAGRVYDAWLDPQWLERWMFGPQVRDERVLRLATEPRVGGRFSYAVDRCGLPVDHVGEYLELDPSQLIVFTWGIRGSRTEPGRVVVEIAGRADDGCDVTVTHIMAAAWTASRSSLADSWRLMLGALDRLLIEENSAVLSFS